MGTPRAVFPATAGRGDAWRRPWKGSPATVNQLAYAFGGSNPSLTTPAIAPKTAGRSERMARRSTLGSAPRPWGRFHHVARRAPQARFTPTPVGTMRRGSADHAVIAVHPHARGDDNIGGGTCRQTRGSPPRPWGRCGRGALRPIPGRFTPTPVGTIFTLPGRPPDRAVHPHARGDDFGVIGNEACLQGSPPRPWGRSALDLDHALVIRFTPTPVGTMPYTASFPFFAAVHPHARGDDGSCMASYPPLDGSPPRPWGRFSMRPISASTSWFTPTPVGTIADYTQCPLPRPVHPHARGDDWFEREWDANGGGSPPRPWGR